MWSSTPGAPAPTAVDTPVANSVANPAANPAASATDAYGAFRGAFDAGRYAEAVPHAQRVVELADTQNADPRTEELQVALMNLGMVQNLTADYVGAEATFQRVIQLAESSGRPQHARLARAHAGLASAYHDGKRHDLAVKSFEQAIALTRRHEGLLTEQQVPLVQKYIDSLTELERYPEALQAQRYLLRIAVRKHGAGSVEITPTLVDIGRWYASAGGYDQSRRVLKQSIDIIEQAEGTKSPRLIRPLLELAACNRRQLLDPTAPQANADDSANRFFDPKAPVAAMGYTPGMLATEGERALLRAEEIIDAQPNPAAAQVLNVQVQLGDWYQLRRQPERALPHYRKGWQAATRTPGQAEGKPYTEAIFGQPALISIVRPENWNRYAYKAADAVEVRTVVIEVIVNAEGRAEQARMIDDSGDARRAERTAQALTETARYRPRFVDGEPVATPGVIFNQPWYLLPTESEPASTQPAATNPPQ